MADRDLSAEAAPLDVVGAVIVDEAGTVLCALRGPTMSLAGHWEFPGGKLGPGESPEQALAREIAEELGCEIAVGELLADHVEPAVPRAVRLRTYTATLVAGTPVALEHAELAWVRPEALGALRWAPADLPTVARLAGLAPPFPSTPPRVHPT